MILFLIQIATTVGCVVALVANMRNYRRWGRETREAHLVAATHAQVTAALLIRGRAWWECDRCGGRLDTGIGVDSPVGLEIDDLGQLVMLCPGCAPAAPTKDTHP